MKKAILNLLVGLAFLLSGCVLDKPLVDATVVPGIATELPQTAPVSAETSSAGSLLAGMEVNSKFLRNLALFSPQLQKTVQLVDGEYEISDNNGRYSGKILQDSFGDLNGDGKEDTAFLLAENAGGTGVFVSLIAVVSRGEQYDQLESVLIDDRPVINSFGVASGEIHLSALLHGSLDDMVSPTFGVTQVYRVLGDKLTLTSLRSTTEGSTQRAIVIDLPSDGESISDEVQITGRMPIGPFENNLSLKVLDLAGNELYASGFRVDAPEMGAPASFNNLVSLPALPSGAWVRVELGELSMADGSLIAMASVVVQIK
ncbi:MAG: hypothetical protein NTZ74_00555 [Chloroflexi bacterium]|nr:hypothetical protein [Chloroflexota bacterium]